MASRAEYLEESKTPLRQKLVDLVRQRPGDRLPDLAKALGVSIARVHQLAKAEGIALAGSQRATSTIKRRKA